MARVNNLSSRSFRVVYVSVRSEVRDLADGKPNMLTKART